jgi:hypothetical protein
MNDARLSTGSLLFPGVVYPQDQQGADNIFAGWRLNNFDWSSQVKMGSSRPSFPSALARAGVLFFRMLAQDGAVNGESAPRQFVLIDDFECLPVSPSIRQRWPPRPAARLDDVWSDISQLDAPQQL